ncbi:MAG: 2-amino-4-hydroxy-6-hydroxymethyldihydropteridine diphosphokinase, partial [Candidatus Marinimicrobia bacterium]|nr:2-amino-4-hydroxy-6-hydroxymethyldihydropteridine diphosphokinase [Candidatus Neomarinimicrobiota bacterium]
AYDGIGAPPAEYDGENRAAYGGNRDYLAVGNLYTEALRDLWPKSDARAGDGGNGGTGVDVLDDDDLQLPHPRYRLRRFVLVPLKEAWPDFCDPRDGTHVDELLEQCPDNSVLRRLIEDKAAK